MARAKTVSVTVRLPVGIGAILNDAVDRGMFASLSDAVRSLVGRTLQVTSQDVVGGPMRGMEIGNSLMEMAPSTTKASMKEDYNEVQEQGTESIQTNQEEGIQEATERSGSYQIYINKNHWISKRMIEERRPSFGLFTATH